MISKKMFDFEICRQFWKCNYSENWPTDFKNRQKTLFYSDNACMFNERSKSISSKTDNGRLSTQKSQLSCTLPVSLYSFKIVIKWFLSKGLDLRLAIDPLPPRGNFVHYDFLKLQYISHKMRHVSPLRVEALSCNNNITYVTL